MHGGVLPNGGSSDEEDAFTDDEEAPLNGEGGPNGQPLEDRKEWDKFRTMPLKDVTGSLAHKETVQFWSKVLKSVAYIVTFIVVLGSAAISKGTLLFMTSQIKPSITHDYCPTDYGSGKDIQVTINQEERVSWIWAIFFSFIAPEFFTWFRSVRICIFRKWNAPKAGDFFLVALFETLHVIGVAFVVYMVLPLLEVAQGAMITNCVCFIPAILGMLSRDGKEDKLAFKIVADVVSILCQLSGCFVWAVLTWTDNGQDAKRNLIWIAPAALILTSIGWWENYVDKNSPFGAIKYLANVKETLKETRYFTYMFLSIWKMVVFFCSLLSIELIWNYIETGRMGNVDHLFNLFVQSFGEHNLTVQEITAPNSPVRGMEFAPIYSWPNTAAIVFGIQAGASLLCFLGGKFACKTCIQGFAYALPMNLTIPLTITILITLCGFKSSDACMFDSAIPGYLFWNCPDGNFLVDILTNEFAWLWLLWLVSQSWISSHIWTPKCERLAATEKLFVHPFYNSLLVDQAMSLNRRRDDGIEVLTSELGNDISVGPDGDMSDYYEHNSNASEEEARAVKRHHGSDSITRIYACATMWHETAEEIVTFLKSVFYLDNDQSARRMAQKYLAIVDPDYYELETHIFFDDAFVISKDNPNEKVVNEYVVDLVNSMDEAASFVHQTNVRVRAPKKIPTPYGGRLVWTLPGKTKIICHLKDKDKIRHKKRWSQCMYMYYLLGHKLMDQPIPLERRSTIADNTYLLALDGDIDFTPDAVQLLVDLMKKNRSVGAACGRIHPVGSGLMAWYQKFEYAIGHWLQKATEHMIGCVLCSPGCFSLFRASALMDDNIMAKYTTISSEARHYVQYDQGEDRWLCTLMLQRGYRVEYSAASDAYTHCPEGFNEFFNQRRRWVPSTMANILDLLVDYKRTISVNDNISLPYVFYQVLLMVGTIVGPGTIFLMIVGSVCAAFKIDQWTSFILNLIPIIIFMIICLTTKKDTQLMFAQLMSIIYAIVMMAVLVGIVLELSVEGFDSPSGIFLLMTAASFVISALLHPQEFWCLPFGLVYYLTVPSMYLLLIIFSLSNLNDVSWGTRETVVKPTPQQQGEEAKKAEAAAKQQAKQGLWANLFRTAEKDDHEGSLEFSLAGLFKIMCCVHKKPNEEALQLARIAESLKMLGSRLDALERFFDPTGNAMRRRSVSSRASVRTVRDSGLSSGSGGVGNNDVILTTLAEGDEDEEIESELEDDASVSNEPVTERDELVNPYWIDDKGLKRGEVDFLDAKEVLFFKELMEKYLLPLDDDKEAKAKAAAALKELRNNTVFAFYIINALYVTVVFLLTLEKENVFIRWPFGEMYTMKYSLQNNAGVVEIETEFLKLEPIGFVFVVFFGSVLVIQFVAMLFHRFGTLTHILASTEIKLFDKKMKDISEEAFLERNGANIARQLQKLDSLDEGKKKNADAQKPARRHTLHFLEEAAEQRQKTHDLETQFRQRLMSISVPEDGQSDAIGRRLSIRRDTLTALGRRASVMNEIRRRSSVHFTNMPRASLSSGRRESSISMAE